MAAGSCCAGRPAPGWRTALHLIGHAEETLAHGSTFPTPEWMDWFTPVRLAAFKGNTQLKAGHLPQARHTAGRP